MQPAFLRVEKCRLRCGVGGVGGGDSGRDAIGSGRWVCGWRTRDRCGSRQSRCAPCVHRSWRGLAASLYRCYSRVSVESARVADVNTITTVHLWLIKYLTWCGWFYCARYCDWCLVWICVWWFASKTYFPKCSKFRWQPGRSSIVGWTPALVLRWAKLSTTLVFAKYFWKT